MAAITLREAAKSAANDGDVLRSGVITLFAESSDLLDAMVWMDIPGNAYKYDQEAALPGIAFRGVNEAYTASTGVINPQTEALFIAGGDLDVDVFNVKTMGEGVRSRQESMKVKSLTATITDKIIKGDNQSAPREFDGFQVRVTGSQLINNSTASGGAGLSLAKLDEMIDQVANPTHLIMSRAMKRKFTAVVRGDTANLAANVNIGKDEIGRPVMMYNDIPILTGYPPNKNTQILPFEEAYNGGGTANGTSIYCARLSEDGVTGIQSGAMEVRDLGELETQPQYRTRVEWYPGMAIHDPYAIARLDSIKDAAITA